MHERAHQSRDGLVPVPLCKRQGIQRSFLGEVRCGRPAPGAGANLAEAGGGAASGGRLGLCEQNQQTDWRCGHRNRGRCWAGCVSGKIGAGCRSVDPGVAARCGLGHKRGHAHGHAAVVGAVTAAAGREARFIVGLQGRRKGPETEEQNQKDGKPAPHLEFHATR